MSAFFQSFLVFIFLLFSYFSLVSRGAEKAAECSRLPGSLPDFQRKVGLGDPRIPIEHIIVIMQENHSFDNYFGRLNQKEFYGSEVDGVLPSMRNLDRNGNSVSVFHEKSLCPQDPAHDWNAMHISWQEGSNEGFLKANEDFVMGYYDQKNLPFYYALADQFAIADRYFASVLSQTFPNRFFLLTGTAFGQIKNEVPYMELGYGQKTIFEVLNQYGISWKYYNDRSKSYLGLFLGFYLNNFSKMSKVKNFAKDLKNHSLPQVIFIDSSYEGEDEHPSSNIQVGQSFVADRVQELIQSDYWKNSVLFLTYDENGGFFDHVAPPPACLPDTQEPLLQEDSQFGRYDRYGFRVPFIAVSPFAKRHYVSHEVYDHTSILKFIEIKFNLPALTFRDANANGLLDLFDFHQITFKPQLPSGKADPQEVCKK